MNDEEHKVRLNSARTFLFVPGDQPDRIKKALAAHTDAVIIDLEDAVRPESKGSARQSLASLIETKRDASSPLILIRTNEASSPEFIEDLKAALEIKVDAIMLPKFVPGESAVAVDKVITQQEKDAGAQNQLPIVGLIETTSGVLNLLNSSLIPERIQRLAFGAADLHTDLGISYSPSNPNSDLAMAAIVLASANAKLGAPIDSPHFTIADETGLRDRSTFAHQMGFGGKLCIHPNQLAIVSDVFTMNQSDKDWAHAVQERWNKRDESSGAVLVDGALVDEAMVKRAKQILGLL